MALHQLSVGSIDLVFCGSLQLDRAAGAAEALAALLANCRGGALRRIRYVTPVEPWQSIDPYGVQLKSDVEYYSASGSVALRWLITDSQTRTCKGEYLIRDDNSLRVVAAGSTPEFNF